MVAPRGWGMCGCSRGDGCSRGGMRGCSRGVCVAAPGGGACMVAWGGHLWLLRGGPVWDTTTHGDTVNERAVRILLECILVCIIG